VYLKLTFAAEIFEARARAWGGEKNPRNVIEYIFKNNIPTNIIIIIIWTLTLTSTSTFIFTWTLN
jgi:hypothetical protein